LVRNCRRQPEQSFCQRHVARRTALRRTVAATAEDKKDTVFTAEEWLLASAEEAAVVYATAEGCRMLPVGGLAAAPKRLVPPLALLPIYATLLVTPPLFGACFAPWLFASLRQLRHYAMFCCVCR